MILHFCKYQGAGNDFIVADLRTQSFPLDKDTVVRLCDRHYGIGSDGLIVIDRHPSYDFAMSFFNPDGSGGMMCGNGGRCAAKYEFDNGEKRGNKNLCFLSPDGVHRAKTDDNGLVTLSMGNVESYENYPDGLWLDTGTSHFVCKTDNLDKIDVFCEGKRLRNDSRFAKHNGCNVNFYQQLCPGRLKIRTYERGVEDETLACGTGIVATAIASTILNKEKKGEKTIEVLSSYETLRVTFTQTDKGFENVFLQGSAVKVFEGEIKI